jgi:tRNA-Thr(GGU) m(6)t(6)A37 methyltransferase TsaA
MTYKFEPIGYIRSCFKEKFGVPRQPGLIPYIDARVEIAPIYQRWEAFQELECFSHIWILFVFHQCQRNVWKATVRPPRLGGNRRVGVFASRSGFRPNPIGQSVVELASMKIKKGSLSLRIKGIDLLDGTPVLDIKPYLPYADSHPQARCGYANCPPQATKQVQFTLDAAKTCSKLEDESRPNLRQMIIDLLALDPRPGYVEATGKRAYGMRLWDLNMKFRLNGQKFIVEDIRKVE